MKKQRKYLLMCVVALVVLGLAFAALKLTEPKPVEQEPDDATTDTVETVYLIEKDYADVETVEISGPNGDYTIIQEEKTIKAEDEDEEDTVEYSYYFDGYKDYSVDSTLGSAVVSLAKLSTNKELGNVEDLEQYGLSGSDVTTVTVNYEDGSKDEIKVGKKASTTFGNYIIYNDSVHISYVNDVLLKDILENVVTYSYKADLLQDQAGNKVDSFFDYINFSGTNFPEDIEVVHNPEYYSNYTMTAPIKENCGPTYLKELAASLENFSADKVEAVNVTQDDLAEYGLDTPFATINYVLNGKEHTLSVSEQFSDSRYLMVDNDYSVVYSVKAATVKDWAELKASTLREAFIFLPYITNVSNFSLECSDIDLSIKIDREIDEENTTDEKVSYNYTSYYLGNEIEYQDNVTSIYMEIIGVGVLNIDKLEHEVNPYLTLKYCYYDDTQQDDIVEFYKATNEDRYVAYRNGEYSGTVRGNSITELVKAVKEFDEANK